MAEENIKNENQNPQGNDPTQPEQGNQEENKFDTSNIEDDQFTKVFEDERLWKHPRFKELTEAKQELKKLREQEQKREEKTLEEQKKFEELAQKRAEEANKYRTQYQQAIVDNNITIELQKAGVASVRDGLKLIEREGIEVDDDGNVSGVADAVKKLLEESPYLKNANAKPNIGEGSNPSGEPSGQPMKFKASQLDDPVFYQKNRQEIMKAFQLGLIEDDK